MVRVCRGANAARLQSPPWSCTAASATRSGRRQPRRGYLSPRRGQSTLAGVPVAGQAAFDRLPLAASTLNSWALASIVPSDSGGYGVTRYPEIEPYDTGMLSVGDGQQLYWETCGNPDGK